MLVQLLLALFYSSYFVLSHNVCPSGSLSWQNNCLFFNSTPAYFVDAQSTCQGIQGNMVSIHDAFYNAFLTENALKNFNVTDFWIGAKTVGWDSVWTWVDGTPFNYSDWRRDEPIYEFSLGASSSSSDGYWSAQSVYEAKPFICEVSKQIFTTTTPTPSITEHPFPLSFNCSLGWSYYQPTGSCYFALKTGQTWANAEPQCQNLGGNLASIHSDAEAYFLFSEYIKPLKTNFWIGLYSEDKENSWKWTDSSAFDYYPWRAGFPQMRREMGCGYVNAVDENVHTHPYFANDFCDEMYHGICKKFYLN